MEFKRISRQLVNKVECLVFILFLISKRIKSKKKKNILLFLNKKQKIKKITKQKKKSKIKKKYINKIKWVQINLNPKTKSFKKNLTSSTN